MIFCGRSFCGGRNTLDHTPTAIRNIQTVRLTNGIFDELYITKNIKYPYTTQISTKWDFDTILHAMFNGNLHAGNVDYSAEEVSHILIKRRKSGTYDWITLFEIPIENDSDFKFQRYDRYAQANTEYEYAIVPVIDKAEGNMNINSVKSYFEGLFLMEKDLSFHTLLEATLTCQKNRPVEVVNGINNRYPFIVSQGNSNWYSGTVSGTFIQRNSMTREWEIEGSWMYRDAFMEFLCNGKSKILKCDDGRMWLIRISDNPSEQAIDSSKIPATSFSWTEAGSYLSEKDLYNNALIDTRPEWWLDRT